MKLFSGIVSSVPVIFLGFFRFGVLEQFYRSGPDRVFDYLCLGNQPLNAARPVATMFLCIIECLIGLPQNTGEMSRNFVSDAPIPTILSCYSSSCTITLTPISIDSALAC